METFAAAPVSSDAVRPPFYSKRVFVPFERAKNWLREADLLLVRAPGVVAWAGRGVHWHAATVSRWGNDWFALEARPGGGRAVPLSAMVERNRRRIDVFRPNPDGRWPEYRPERAVALTRRAVALRYGWASVFKAAAARIPFFRYFFAESYFDDAATRVFPRTFAVDDETGFFDASKNSRNDASGAETASDSNSDSVVFSETNGAGRGARDDRRADVSTNGAAARFQRFFAPFCERESLDELVKIWRKAFPKTTLQCAETRALADRYAGVDPVPFLNDRFVEPADLARSPFYRYQFSFDALES